MPKIFRVTGDSMYPTLSNNDILVTCKKKNKGWGHSSVESP